MRSLTPSPTTVSEDYEVRWLSLIVFLYRLLVYYCFGKIERWIEGKIFILFLYYLDLLEFHQQFFVN